MRKENNSYYMFKYIQKRYLPVDEDTTSVVLRK